MIEQINEAQATAYKAEPIRLGGANVNFLQPGESVQLTRAEHPSNGYESFARFGLHNLAAALGVTAEQLTQDWSKTNLSSARAALAEMWRLLAMDRADFAAGFMAPWYMAWLEEAFEKDMITLPANAPAFDAAREAWTACRWIAPAKGFLDPEKDAIAAGLRMANNLSTLEREASEQGYDYRDIIEQRARERAEMAEAGLDPDAARPASYDRSAASEEQGEARNAARRTSPVPKISPRAA
jgi:lambda family phage portal protein